MTLSKNIGQCKNKLAQVMLSNCLLKSIKEGISKLLTITVNQSIQQGRIPDTFKVAH